jgi:beta-ureidopropionase / N-carbamoyl-L-amino-acid hydrolase
MHNTAAISGTYGQSSAMRSNSRIEPDFDLAQVLFEGFARDGASDIGFTRPSYGEGEEKAHTRVRALAETLGLTTRVDAALNLYVVYRGKNSNLPVAMTGSHLDTVPCGGNFDGAAGVVAGLAIFSAWKKAGFIPDHDCIVMAIRAEESAWFPVSYPGSKAAFGLLSREALELTRVDTGRTLGSHIDELGGDSESLAARKRYLDPKQIARFIELHIEQGPHLINQDIPVGIVTGIRGSTRYRHAAAVGSYAHSGAVPRYARADAVLATSHLLVSLDQEWTALEDEGRDIVVTAGCFATEAGRADFSKISGRVDFSIDVRSCEEETLKRMDETVLATTAEISARSGVSFKLGQRTGSAPAVMDASLRRELHDASDMLGIKVTDMPSGAGHDSSVFANQGVPTAMIFVRNANGSHNPDEAMEFEDFKLAVRLLESCLCGPAL